MEPIEFFAEIKEKKKRREEEFSDGQSEIVKDDEPRFSYYDPFGLFGCDWELLVEESKQLMEKCPVCTAAIIIEDKKDKKHPFFEVYVKTEKNKFLMQLQVNENVYIEPFLYIFERKESVFSKNENEIKRLLHNYPLMTGEKEEYREILHAFQCMMMEHPRFRLRFVTGNLIFSNEQEENYLR